ncbi:MAG: hypothetical protein KDA60_15460 [Planctomycetales bacterium]|nr:hypothetical protein [Planctomycetales bacterium]
MGYWGGVALLLWVGCQPTALGVDGMTATDYDAKIDLGCIDCYFSDLVPEGWYPGYSDEQGRFVHDFSYAGYRYGEGQLVDQVTAVAMVDAFGADPSGVVDSTAAVQQAIDSLTGGGTVLFGAGTYKLAGRIAVTQSHVVLAGQGASTRLQFTKYSDMNNKSHLQFGSKNKWGAEQLLVEDGASLSTEVAVADAAVFTPGMDVAVGWYITDAFVSDHGMTGVWEAFNGQWSPFFWRTVVSVDIAANPNTVTLDVPLRYNARVRDAASLRVVSHAVSECGLRDMQISNASTRAQAWTTNQVSAVRFVGVKDCRIDRVSSFQPAGREGHLISGGIIVEQSKRVTISNVHLGHALHRGDGGNGYLFEIRQSAEILTEHSTGVAGRHNFIQNWGFGTSGCVWLQCDSREGRAYLADWDPIGQVGYSEFHHSLAMANLIDGGEWNDGFAAKNRGTYSTGAGHSATENVFWNPGGSGTIQSKQYGYGFVIGPADSLSIEVAASVLDGAAPDDYVEVVPDGLKLAPSSLYQWQRARRLSTP